MPIGVLVNALAIATGGILGTIAGGRLSQDFKEKLNMVFGCCSFAMGISSICLMENMPAVVFSVIIGTSIGLAVHLGDWIQKGAILLQKGIASVWKMEKSAEGSAAFREEQTSMLITIIVLFCASGTGIYGSIVAGMEGDHSILIAKSILDLPTAMIFACGLGAVVAFIAIPQFLIFFLLLEFGYQGVGLLPPPVQVQDAPRLHVSRRAAPGRPPNWKKSRRKIPAGYFTRPV